MINKLLYLFGVFIGLLMAIFGLALSAGDVGAVNHRQDNYCDPSLAIGEGMQCTVLPETELVAGFLTLANPKTGTQVVAYCESDIITSAVVINVGEEAYSVGTSMGVKCEASSLPGFEVVINIDPREGGWVIAPPQLVASHLGIEHAEMAYACTSDGMVFAIKHPGKDLDVFSRPGECKPGNYPG